MKLSLYKNVLLGGMVAGSLIAVVPAVADDFHADHQELRHDQRVIDRDNEQLARDRRILDEHVHNGSGRKQIAMDQQRVREDEAKLRSDGGELRHDDRGYSSNDWYRR